MREYDRLANAPTRIVPRSTIPREALERVARLLDAGGWYDAAAMLRRRARGIGGSWYTPARVEALRAIAEHSTDWGETVTGEAVAACQGAATLLQRECVAWLGEARTRPAPLSPRQAVRLTRALVLAVEVLREARGQVEPRGLDF